MTTPAGAAVPRRVLGRSGIEVSAVGMGCWPIGGPDHNLGMPMGWAPVDEATAVAGLQRAFQLGANLFDTADVYGHGRSERLLGRLVAQVPRNAIVLTSKVGYFAGTAPHGYHPRHLCNQLEQSLDNLGVEHLDMYFLHHLDFGPDDRYLDGAVEVMRGFKADGLITAIGMRGPHRFALDRLTTEPELRGDKVARFRALFDRIGARRARGAGQPADPGGPVGGHLRLGRRPQLRRAGQQAARPGPADRQLPAGPPPHVRGRGPPDPQALVRPGRDPGDRRRASTVCAT